MLFNSGLFFIFLLIILVIYFVLNRLRFFSIAKIALVMASFIFYGYGGKYFVLLLLSSILVNYAIAWKMAGPNKGGYKKAPYGKFLLILGLAFNLGLLGFFKYADFVINNVNFFAKTGIPELDLIFPLAISFFTLQQIAFLVDTYEGLVDRRDFLDYSIFVSFFPQLIAGPIVHHKEMMPQFASQDNKLITPENISAGLFIFIIGLTKKIVFADNLAMFVDSGYTNAAYLSLLGSWITALAFTFQVYFDFSGYTDMAIGAALMFNINLPINFNSPFKAKSIIEFWQRWHITLTRFLTTYIYMAILRSLKKINLSRAVFAVMVTWLISGLWHGPTWLFVIFGAIHGVALSINYVWRKYKQKMNPFLGWFLTFNVFVVSMVFFRAGSLDTAMEMLKGMFGFHEYFFPQQFESSFSFMGLDHGAFTCFARNNFSTATLILIVLCMTVCWFAKNSNELITIIRKPGFVTVPYIVLMALSIVIFGCFDQTSYIYFQF